MPELYALVREVALWALAFFVLTLAFLVMAVRSEGRLPRMHLERDEREQVYLAVEFPPAVPHTVEVHHYHHSVPPLSDTALLALEPPVLDVEVVDHDAQN